MKKITSMVAVLLISGCANNVWVHPSKNNAQFNQDKNDCIVQANNAIPRQIVPQQPSPPPAYTTNCYGSSNMASCTTTPQYQPNYTATAQAIADGSTNRSRDNFFSSCMQSRGWNLQSAESVATNQAQLEDRKEQFRAAMRDISQQVDQMCANPELSAYFAKTPCNSADSTLIQLSDTTKANKKEKEAISKLDVAVVKFLKEKEEVYSRYVVPPSLAQKAVALNKKYGDKAQKLRLELFNGKITWGQYNTERKQFGVDADSEFKALFQNAGSN